VAFPVPSVENSVCSSANGQKSPVFQKTRVKCLLVASNHQEKTWRHPWLFFEQGGLNGVDMLILKAALGQVNRLENPSGTIAGRQ